MMGVALVVLVRGAWSRPGLAAVIGLLVASAGMLALAVSASPGWAVPIGVGTGAGNGLFSAHVAPLVLGRTAATHLARIQSVVGLAQSLPLLATNNLIGGLVDAVGASTALGGCALALAIGALVALRSTALRHATLPGQLSLCQLVTRTFPGVAILSEAGCTLPLVEHSFELFGSGARGAGSGRGRATPQREGRIFAGPASGGLLSAALRPPGGGQRPGRPAGGGVGKRHTRPATLLRLPPQR